MSNSLSVCVFYHSVTIYDMLLPKFLAGQIITEDTIAIWAMGTVLCNDRNAIFPDSPFGR